MKEKLNANFADNFLLVGTHLISQINLLYKSAFSGNSIFRIN